MTASSTATGPAPAAIADEPLIVADGLTKAYGDQVAIRGVSLAITPGRVVGLLGANGAGKTTTIRCMVGLLTPDAGSTRILGADVHEDRRQVGRLVGLAGQEPALYPELSVAVNLRFFAELAGLTRQEAQASVEDLSSSLRITELLDRRVRTLSGGQRQLVHVAVAFVHHPRLVILDEPTVGLDVTARARFLGAVGTLAAAGTSILLSSHQMGEVEQVCDDVVIIHEGRVVAEGPLVDLIARHGEPYVELTTIEGATRVPGTGLREVLDGRTAEIDEIESISVIRPSLESVFLTLTGARLLDGESR